MLPQGWVHAFKWQYKILHYGSNVKYNLTNGQLCIVTASNCRLLWRPGVLSLRSWRLWTKNFWSILHQENYNSPFEVQRFSLRYILGPFLQFLPHQVCHQIVPLDRTPLTNWIRSDRVLKSKFFVLLLQKLKTIITLYQTCEPDKAHNLL